MNYKILNRNTLKWIALITMFLDHIGAIIGFSTFANMNIGYVYDILRIIGRISFPIFAFFIAEGWFFTHNKFNYFSTILIFAIISQPIYSISLDLNIFNLNILWTFLLSISICYLIDKYKQNLSYSFLYSCLIFCIIMVVLFLELLGLRFSYGIFGIILPVIFYIFYHNNLKNSKLIMWICVVVLLIALSIINIPINTTIKFSNFYQFFGLLSIPFIILYNGKKGKYNFKWLFYIFYPTHLIIIYLFSLLI